jgi:hypothetical protein
MKFSFHSILIAASCCLSLSSAADVSPQPAQCLETGYDPNTDYFPTKVSPTLSKSWSIEYYNTYKVVKNLAANKTYLLYQCGTTPPSDVSAYSGNFSIPLTSVGLDQTPVIPYLEQLGVIDKVSVFMTLKDYISSPCLLESIESGNVALLTTNEELLASGEVYQNLQAAFLSSYSTITAANAILVSENTELTSAAIFEWIKFYAAFFNLEAHAEDIFAKTQSYWNCVADNAEQVFTADTKRPLVLWGSYSDYCKGWDIGECPNYYCEFAQACSADIISNSDGTYNEECGANYLTTQEFVFLGMKADHWFYTDTNWDSVYAANKEELDKMTSVQNKRVFDLQGSGSNAWFEQRYAEYFAALQDFCHVVGTTRRFDMRQWFRNVFTDPIGSVGQCTENSRSNSIIPGSLECGVLTPPDDTTPQPDEDVETSAAVMIHHIVFAALASTLTMCF